MHLSEAVINELASAWIGIHGSAAQAHLELVIMQLRRSGDVDGAVNYARVLEAMRAKVTLPETGILLSKTLDFDEASRSFR